jgi:predicted amidohydrolase YtcJ
VTDAPDLIVHNAKLTTLDRATPLATAFAVREGRFVAVGDEAEIMALRRPATQTIDAGKQRVIPGLNDNHTHVIRGGLSYNLELRWDGVASLADAMAMLKAQIAVTPPPQWVRVAGGFTHHQFVEKRLPTLDEINAIAPDTPVFILHLYDRGLLNRAALRACGYTKDTPNPPAGEIVRDASGEPTGLLIAKPNAGILYATVGKMPKLPPEYQVNSTKLFLRELNRLGVTSFIDAGGGSQSYPEDYAIINQIAADGDLTVRISYNLFTQKPKQEKEDFLNWSRTLKYQEGNDYFRLNGGGEMLVYSAADFEDFHQPRPDMPPQMESELEDVVRILAQNRWPWRLHATYDETISRALDVFETVARDIPLDGINWFFDHAETVSDHSLERIARLGGGIAVQHRIMYQGEEFVARYGAAAAERTPPIARMLEMGIPVSAGTDATRVASYNPWVSIAWLVTGRTLGGLRLYPVSNRLDRETALRMWTEKVTWFSNETGKKGQIAVGQFADFTMLDRDYFTVPEDEIRHITAVLTAVGGKVVHGSGDFKNLAPPLPRAMPDWSPVNRFGGYQGGLRAEAVTPREIVNCCDAACGVHGHAHAWARRSSPPVADEHSFWGVLGCSCWAF